MKPNVEFEHKPPLIPAKYLTGIYLQGWIIFPKNNIIFKLQNNFFLFFYNNSVRYFSCRRYSSLYFEHLRSPFVVVIPNAPLPPGSSTQIITIGSGNHIGPRSEREKNGLMDVTREVKIKFEDDLINIILAMYL